MCVCVRARARLLGRVHVFSPVFARACVRVFDTIYLHLLWKMAS